MLTANPELNIALDRVFADRQKLLQAVNGHINENAHIGTPVSTGGIRDSISV